MRADPDAPGRDPGAALRRRARSPAFSTTAGTGRVGATTAVFDRAGPGALLLQGGACPTPAARSARTRRSRCSTTSGVYAYRRAALTAYSGWPIGPLETWEGLEQLRFMENGTPVHCVEVAGPRPAVLGAQQPDRRAADRGDPARAGHRLMGGRLPRARDRRSANTPTRGGLRWPPRSRREHSRTGRGVARRVRIERG